MNNSKYSIPNNKPLYYQAKDKFQMKFQVPKMPLAIRNLHFSTNQKMMVILIIGTYSIQNMLEVIG